MYGNDKKGKPVFTKGEQWFELLLATFTAMSRYAHFVLLILALLIGASSCHKEAKVYGIYESKLSKRRVRVDFVGMNWQIKDAVNAGNLQDQKWYHSDGFWRERGKYVIASDAYGWSTMLPEDAFTKEYSPVEKP
jgi:hypothetical protein